MERLTPGWGELSFLHQREKLEFGKNSFGLINVFMPSLVK